MIGATLDNYRILEKIGEGGQGTVYKAVDTRLGRNAVVKVLPPELTTKEANLKRFEREARLASSLDHPNICTIYDLGDVGNVHYIAMQYIEGKNVRQLVDGRPLDLKSALSIAIQVTDALVAAHSRGIIHRDIKAGNVMVTKAGQAKILDFGLAKLVDESQAQLEGIHQTELTEIGIPYGTATYAAPEQARGDRVDHRADIFSTGVLLYEMLTGIWPFQGKTSVDVRHAVIHDQPVPIAEARPGQTPPALQAILDRAMAKEPRERYQTAVEIRDELRRVLREVSSEEVGDVNSSSAPVAPRHMQPTGRLSRAIGWLRKGKGTDSTRSVHDAQNTPRGRTTPDDQAAHETPATSTGDHEKKSIAILPFRNLTKDPAIAFYEFSLADAVITELARIRSLVVRSSSVIARFQGETRDPREIGRELKVTAVLAATFIKSGDRLRVTGQLLDVESGKIIWSDRIDATTDDIIALQDNIARHIVDGLRIELSSDEQVGLAGPTTGNAAAYEEYLRGRDLMGRYIYHTLAKEDIDAATTHFKRALELDPKFALAHAALGGCYANLVMKAQGDTNDYVRAEQEFEEALAIDPNILEARMHRVFIFLAQGQKKRAREEASRLSYEAPNDTGVAFAKAYMARLDGDYEKALRALDRMLRLNPSERVVVSYNRARIFLYQGRLDDALLELDQGSAVEPDHPLVKTFRAVALFRKGDPETAREIFEEVLAGHPEMDGIRPLYAESLIALGEEEAARAQLTERVKQVAAADHDAPYWLASAYVMLGENDEALRWLETAINLGNENFPWFESNPLWEPLRDDPRFMNLMQRIESGRVANPV